MAAHGKNKYYRLRDIQPRHFLSTAQRCGAGSQMQYIIDDLIAQIPQVIETVDD